MKKLLSKYNQNRKFIWIVVLSIIAVFSLIQILNLYYKNHPKEDKENKSIAKVADDNYSIISQENISKDTSDKSKDIINDFFEFCNNGKIEEAYNLLSSDCKEELYPSIEEFKTNYVEVYFDKYKTYNASLWISSKGKNTYRLEIMGDILSSGQVDNMPTEEFYTVLKENDEYKLNIETYIGKEDINAYAQSESGIEITVLNKKIYMEYEEYQIQIKNNTGNKILFNTKENIDSIYIEDANGLKYNARLYELNDLKLELSRGTSTIFNIKFDREYNPNIKIKKIVFDDINLIYEEKIERVEIEL